MLMQCQRACSKIWRDEEENNQEITAEVQGIYPNSKQSQTKFSREKFSHVKSQRKPTNVYEMPSRSSKVPKVEN